jgi:hypothetical protein
MFILDKVMIQASRIVFIYVIGWLSKTSSRDLFKRKRKEKEIISMQ